MHRTAVGYDTDFALWAEEQAAALREGRWGAVDVEHVIEELDGLAGRDRREVKSRLEVLIMHLLKAIYQHVELSRSWSGTIIEQSRRIRDVIEDSPSLRGKLPTYCVERYRDARELAAGETKFDVTAFPPALSEHLLTLVLHIIDASPIYDTSSLFEWIEAIRLDPEWTAPGPNPRS